MLVLSSTVMGRRKLRFHHCKNYERRKLSQGTLPVSINLSESVMVFRVSLPLSFASSCTVSTLHARMAATPLPPNWESQFDTEQNVLIVYRLRTETVKIPASIDFSLAISQDFSWKIHVCGRLYECLSYLAACRSRLRSVQDVLGVVHILHQSQICVGNADEKYVDVIKHHKGTLRDRSGTVS